MKIWWIKSDICGMFCALFTIGLLLYAEIVIANVIILPWLGFDYNFIIFTSLTILALVAHTRCQFTDPGTISTIYIPPALPRDLDFSLVQARPYNPPKICKTCRTLKTRRTFHCNTCERCILNMDHHCPWVNNCVGANNQRFFFQFLFFTAVSCLYCAVLLVLRFVSCHDSDLGCEVSSYGVLFSIITFIEALVFGIFTIVMMYDQITGLLEEEFRNEQFYKTQNIAYTAAMEGEAQFFSDPPQPPVKKSTYQLFTEVFGGGFGLSWFNPFVQPQQIMKYQIDQLEGCSNHAEHVTHRFVEYARQLNDEFEQEQLQLAKETHQQHPPREQQQQQQPPKTDPQHKKVAQDEDGNNDINPEDFDDNEQNSNDDEQKPLITQRKVPVQ